MQKSKKFLHERCQFSSTFFFPEKGVQCGSLVFRNQEKDSEGQIEEEMELYLGTQKWKLCWSVFLYMNGKRMQLQREKKTTLKIGEDLRKTQRKILVSKIFKTVLNS